MKKLILIFLTLIAFQSQAYKENAYKDPIYTYDYVSDIEKLLSDSLKRNKWKLVKNEEGKYFAEISHKKYKIKAAIKLANKSIVLDLDSVTKEHCKLSCKISKKDKEKVQGWLLRLRKSIALNVTTAVRKAALKQMLLKE